jgi:ribosomal protein S18 acetylase RimI-like enzyme
VTDTASGWPVRRAGVEDAAAISQLIRQTLQETNARDYAPVIVARVVANFMPNRIAALIASREAFVATRRQQIVATASLDGATIRSVFVLPEFQMRGVGRTLMEHVESVARAGGLVRLAVPSSIGAEGFYRRLGYASIRDVYYEDERTILMEKTL